MSGFGINTSNIPCESMFSQNGQLLIFCPKFGEIAQLRAIFWLKYCWGCYRDLGGNWNKLGRGGWGWVEVEMSWVEVDEVRWSWVEVHGAGWRWVRDLVIHIIENEPLISAVDAVAWNAFHVFMKYLKALRFTAVLIWTERTFQIAGP